MKLGRRSFLKGLASLALLPSLAWAKVEKLETPDAVGVTPIEREWHDEWMRQDELFYQSINGPDATPYRGLLDEPVSYEKWKSLLAGPRK